jgi:copper chaperone CopZ
MKRRGGAAMEAVTVKLKIGGMTCVSCESRIERKLKSTAGVTDAEVHYSNGTAVVSFDEEKISLTEIIGIIEKLDYKAEVQDQKDRRAEKRGKPENPWILKLLGVAVIIFAVYMISGRFGVLP